MSGKASATGPTWSEKDVQAMFSFMAAVNNDLAESGEMLGANGLVEPAQTLPHSLKGASRAWGTPTVSAGTDGKPVISDGPYGETRSCSPATGCSNARVWSG